MAETGVYRCPCCGDDVMGTFGRPCDDCQTAGCEMTRDGTGELGYWECQREGCPMCGANPLDCDCPEADPIDLQDAARGDLTPGGDGPRGPWDH